MTTNEADRPSEVHSTPSGDSPISELPVIERTEKDEIVADAPEPVRSASYDPRPHTTRTRGRLALGMTILLGLTVLGAFILAWRHEALNLTIEQVNGFAAPLISTEAALLGTALGFYFGDRSAP